MPSSDSTTSVMENRNDASTEMQCHDDQDNSMGTLARQLMTAINGSESLSLDLDEAASLLDAPLLALHDVSDALEGLGMLERRESQTNTVQVKSGSGDNRNCHSIREEIAKMDAEEALLDQWIDQMKSITAMRSSQSVDACDIASAVLQTGTAEDTREVSDENNRPSQSIFAIHSRGDSIACVPEPRAGSTGRSLYVGSRPSYKQYSVDNVGRGSGYGAIVPRSSASGQGPSLYMLPIASDGSQMKPAGCRSLTEELRNLEENHSLKLYMDCTQAEGESWTTELRSDYFGDEDKKVQGVSDVFGANPKKSI